MVDVTLTYYKTEVVEGRTYHYLKAVMFPTDLTGDILLKVLSRLGENIAPFFNVATSAPVVIPQGYKIYNYGGGYWEAPSDLYKHYVYDVPVILDYLQGGFAASVPFVVYCEEAPVVDLPLTSLPDDGVRPALAFCRAGNSVLYIPEGQNIVRIIAASRLNDYPFWTRTCPVNWWVYSGCRYVIVDPPRMSHHTVLLTYYTWVYAELGPGVQEGAATLMHSGHALGITSCRTAWGQYSVATDTDGDVSYTYCDVLMPVSPVFVVSPQLVDLPRLTVRPRHATPRGGSNRGSWFDSLFFGGSVGKLSGNARGTALRDECDEIITDHNEEDILQ